MTIGGGEAADQMVRMMLSGGEAAVRLGGSALKNLLALTMALAKHDKVLSGKVNMNRMLRETRDLRLFPMSPEQFRQFQKHAKKQKILFSAIKDRDGSGRVIDVVMPVTELDRANLIFERILYQGPPRRNGTRGPRPGPSGTVRSHPRTGTGNRPNGPRKAPSRALRNRSGRCPRRSRRAPSTPRWGGRRAGGTLPRPGPSCRTTRGISHPKKILGRDQTRAIPEPAPLLPEGAAGGVTGRPSWRGWRRTVSGWTVAAGPPRPGRKPGSSPRRGDQQ